jgi:hypothetical protein
MRVLRISEAHIAASRLTVGSPLVRLSRGPRHFNGGWPTGTPNDAAACGNRGPPFRGYVGQARPHKLVMTVQSNRIGTPRKEALSEMNHEMPA